ncbi:MAG: translation initiation factor IF-2 N-terminal domain-containing protein, partial [Mycobacterium sp.]
MVDGAPPTDTSEEPTRHDELPDRLRVHSLARTLGTTSKRVLDALSALDGRIRSAHSTVDRDDAVRVRDLLAAAQPLQSAENTESSAAVVTAGAESIQATATDEPESRLMLETAAERPHYMPLFVAPQPIETDDDGSADDSDDSDDSD